jgi:hypothetical protein
LLFSGGFFAFASLLFFSFAPLSRCAFSERTKHGKNPNPSSSRLHFRSLPPAIRPAIWSLYASQSLFGSQLL